MADPSAPIRIWVVADHHAAFRCGGWAYVREAGGSLSGAAGGERYVTPERIELCGLAAALAGLPPSAPVLVRTPSARLAVSTPRLAGVGDDDAPGEDLDLWARIVTAAHGRAVRILRSTTAPKTPAAFCAAWAELARDKAKASGAFAAAIPRTNLARIEGLG